MKRWAALAVVPALGLALGLVGCGSGTQVSMSFARRVSLYDAPFPSDDLRLPDGHIDVSKVPNPNHVDLMNQALALLSRDARGFALAGGVFFHSDAPIDRKSLPSLQGSVQKDASVFLVGVDPAQPDFRQRRPIDVAFLTDGGPFGDYYLLGMVPLQGAPLRPRARYAAVVTRRVRDTGGSGLVPSAEMSVLAAGDRPADLSQDVFDEYEDALKQLQPLVDRDNVVALAVFTTDDPTAQLPLVRDDALLHHAVAVPSPSPSPTDVYDDYCVFHAVVDMPTYQSGPPPYDQTGGDWLFDDAGQPIFDHSEPANVWITTPRQPTPAGGWPMVLFVRTGGGGDRPLIERGQSLGDTFTQPVAPGSGPAMYFARAGFAAVQVDGPIGGLRNTTDGNEDLLIFNVFNAAALRDNVRESAMELSLFARVIPSISFDASLCPGAGRVTVDAAHLAMMGHSMGSWIQPLTMAFEPSLGAGVMSGAGGSYIANVMDKIKPLHVRPLAEILLDYNMDQRSLDWHDPALTFVQWAAEPSDPQVYDPLVLPRHLLMLQGIVDHYILPTIANATSLALGLDQAGPAYDADNAEEQMLMEPALAPLLPLVGRGTLSLPASGNASGGASTAVVVQHPGDDIEDGHEVVFQTDPPKHQYSCFLQSFLRGVPTVPPDGAPGDPCD